MPTNLALRLSAVSHSLVTRNRKVPTQANPWSKAVVAGLFLAAMSIVVTCVFWAWANLQITTLNYDIAQARDIKKQHMELNKRLRVEHSSLTAIARLEHLAATFNMGPPAPEQVVKVNWP
jgi:cell division protein FtsL